MGSVSFKFDGLDWKKIKVGAGVAFGGALIAFLPEALAGIHFIIQLGTYAFDYTVFVGMAASVLVNAVRKWVSDNSEA